jgi:6-pyruvoyltetrahydropterin/6-carboxytetrahydropterin synthase
MSPDMFSLGLERRFVARHRLIGGDWGPENKLHPHDYRLELRLEGTQLDSHSFLVDLVDLERQLDSLVGKYRDRVLNELPAFAGFNPSLERFAQILCQQLAGEAWASGLHAVTVRLWENDSAWAAFRKEI